YPGKMAPGCRFAHPGYGAHTSPAITPIVTVRPQGDTVRRPRGVPPPPETVMPESEARTRPRAPDSAVAPAAADPAADIYAAPLDQPLVRQIIVGIMLAMFRSALEQTIVAPALPTLGRVLADADNLPFVVTAYLLAATAVTPLFGKFADIHGRRLALL